MRENRSDGCKTQSSFQVNELPVVSVKNDEK